MWNAALRCDHGPFRVVVVDMVGAVTYACIYSSEQHLWSNPISAPVPAGDVSSTQRTPCSHRECNLLPVS
ncbi:hypothetical protein PR202_gb12130 [Eleusine coracana subsp. coracana]|uniref:Uncharacterized protein n=1 Tax=Eleusine coracana subsp. coracana TaxID=191504 RepID=A0AAV5ENI4_ELECO|nr:hypothetical protein PR202_gb12130 [Eleusine coracana subsp. coracana]